MAGQPNHCKCCCCDHVTLTSDGWTDANCSESSEMNRSHLMSSFGFSGGRSQGCRYRLSAYSNSRFPNTLCMPVGASVSGPPVADIDLYTDCHPWKVVYSFWHLHYPVGHTTGWTYTFELVGNQPTCKCRSEQLEFRYVSDAQVYDGTKPFDAHNATLWLQFCTGLCLSSFCTENNSIGDARYEGLVYLAREWYQSESHQTDRGAPHWIDLDENMTWELTYWGKSSTTLGSTIVPPADQGQSVAWLLRAYQANGSIAVQYVPASGGFDCQLDTPQFWDLDPGAPPPVPGLTWPEPIQLEGCTTWGGAKTLAPEFKMFTKTGSPHPDDAVLAPDGVTFGWIQDNESTDCSALNTIDNVDEDLSENDNFILTRQANGDYYSENGDWQMTYHNGGKCAPFQYGTWVMRARPTGPFSIDTPNEDAVYLHYNSNQTTSPSYGDHILQDYFHVRGGVLHLWRKTTACKWWGTTVELDTREFTTGSPIDSYPAIGSRLSVHGQCGQAAHAEYWTALAPSVIGALRGNQEITAPLGVGRNWIWSNIRADIFYWHGKYGISAGWILRTNPRLPFNGVFDSDREDGLYALTSTWKCRIIVTGQNDTIGNIIFVKTDGTGDATIELEGTV